MRAGGSLTVFVLVAPPRAQSHGMYSMDPGSHGDVYKVLKGDFDQRYNGNRSPMPVYFHLPWMTPDHMGVRSSSSCSWGPGACTAGSRWPSAAYADSVVPPAPRVRQMAWTASSSTPWPTRMCMS